MKFILIETSNDMDAMLDHITNQPIIAVDTEFQRETTYYPKLALVQIATDSNVICIDPVAFDAKPALKEILLNKNIEKVFHACSQDMEVLYYYLGETPDNIYDTQIANAFLSDHHQIGYAALVENELGIQLDKSQTRTNWLQRPLTEKQIQYAGDDVLYLYQLHNILDDKLQQAGRKSWFTEECSNLRDNQNNFQVDVKKLWRRVKGATKLSQNTLIIVQYIAEWREQLAQQKDRIRRKILTDTILIQLAFDKPETINYLDPIIISRDRSQYQLNENEKQQLIEIIQSAQQAPESEWPDNRFSVLDNQQKAELKNLQQLVNDKAEELSLSSAIISSRKDLENLILINSTESETGASPIDAKLNIVQGWRLRCIGQQLLDRVASNK
ncbi:Ribonuclease D [hydrothermal vent metagenome]|uniref:Ribonuclease D n=1 Tax=hydrothermal vent metagenome TaxID=652676 RepID=A0A3B0X439_9ZZZZ